MSDVDTRIRDYLTRTYPGWDTGHRGLLGQVADAVLSACSSIERQGGQQIALAELRNRIAAELGVRTEDQVEPISQPCNHCSALIIWATTDTGAPMPVDAKPTPDGTVTLHRGRATVLGRTTAAAHHRAGQPVRRPHANTCPYSARWRTAR